MKGETLTRTNRPLVAVLDAWTTVVHALEDAGAEVVEVEETNDIGRATRFVDAIVLTGGGDVNPKRYGADRHHTVNGIDNSRDRREVEAIRLARRRGCLIMGICRGHQLLNVTYGGTLIQDLDSLFMTDSHGYGEHAVTLRRKSKLAASLRTTTLASMITLHHQAVDRVGDGLLPAGWSLDGIIEAIESAPGEKPYALGVQFHPEMDYNRDRDARGIFQHFVNMARRHTVGRGRYVTRWRDFERLADEIWSRRKSYHASPYYSRHEESHWGENSYTDDLDGWGGYHVTSQNACRGDWYHGGSMDADRMHELDMECAFPPCKNPYSCDVYNDCQAEVVARVAARRDEAEAAFAKTKRKPRKKTSSKGYVNKGGGKR